MISGDQLFWVIVATIVAGVLRWAEHRWPGDDDRPPRRRRRRPPDDEPD